MTEHKTKILIDCDPWADDYFALLWAIHMQKKELCEIVAITTSAWNVSRETTFKNAHRACNMMGVTLPIWIARDTWNNEEWAEHIHWNDWIWWASQYLSLPKSLSEDDSEDLIIKNIEQYWEELIILEFWPMTNLANVERRKPWLLKKAKSIIAMWWAIFSPWNVTPTSEFNINFDPESAQVVLQSWANTTLIPLDATHKTLFRPADLDEVIGYFKNKNYWLFIKTLAQNTFKTNMMFRETRDKEWFIVHDACTVAFLFYPHLFSWSFLNVNVECKWEFTRWKTQVDIRNSPTPNANAFVILDVDGIWFMEAMTEDFKEIWSMT